MTQEQEFEDQTEGETTAHTIESLKTRLARLNKLQQLFAKVANLVALRLAELINHAHKEGWELPKSSNGAICDWNAKFMTSIDTLVSAERDFGDRLQPGNDLSVS